MGFDLAGPVLVAMMFGFLGLVTLPVGTTLLEIWFVAAVIVTLVWWLRRWRAMPTDKNMTIKKRRRQVQSC